MARLSHKMAILAKRPRVASLFSSNSEANLVNGVRSALNTISALRDAEPPSPAAFLSQPKVGCGLFVPGFRLRTFSKRAIFFASKCTRWLLCACTCPRLGKRVSG